MIHDIGSRRILFTDDRYIYRTTAARRLHEPVRREAVYVFDAPEEGCFTGSYLTLLYEDGLYRIYYINNDLSPEIPRKVCVLVSHDGLRWEKPALRDGFNTVFDPRDYDQGIDNFIPFVDRNPAVKPEEKYKAFSGLGRNNLHVYASPDGYHWHAMFDNRPLEMEGAFDSSNLAFWDPLRGYYCAFVRDFHDVLTDDALDCYTRDIRVSYSDDFEHWTKPEQVEFGNSPDVPMYVSEYRDTFDNCDELADDISTDADINLFGVSVCRIYAREAKQILLSKGIKANIVDIMWLKPFDALGRGTVLKDVPLGLVVDSGREICGAPEHLAYQMMLKYPGSRVETLGVSDEIKTTNPNCMNNVPTAEMIAKRVCKMLEK